MSQTALIVDDNANLAYFTAYNLKKEFEDLNVLTAGSYGEALSVATATSPRLAIVDLILPDGDGLELISELKKNLPDMIAILVTATPLAIGINSELHGLLLKPYDIEELIDLVRTGLQPAGYQQDEAVPVPRCEPIGSPRTQADFHHVQNRLSASLAAIRALRLEIHAVAEDPEEVKRIIDEYTDRLSAMVKEAAETLKRKA